MLMHIARFERHARLKLLCLFGGMTAGTGAVLLSQGCPGGQCAACAGNCATRLPFLALPLLVQAVVVLVGRVRRLG
jgi:hypothetical protein